jgi:hypothetical protein
MTRVSEDDIRQTCIRRDRAGVGAEEATGNVISPTCDVHQKVNVLIYLQGFAAKSFRDN